MRSLSLIVTNHLSVTISYFVNRSPRLRHRLPRRQGAPATSTKWLIYCVTDSSSAVSFFLVFQNIVESIQAFPSHLSARLFAYQCSSSTPMPAPPCSFRVRRPRTNIARIFRAIVSVPQPSVPMVDSLRVVPVLSGCGQCTSTILAYENKVLNFIT